VSPLPSQDDEHHAKLAEYVSRNRDALNESIAYSRQEIANGKISSKSIDQIIAEGRRRHRQA
jgi:hypothetical protein